MNITPLYLDYAATTPVDERVAALMVDCLCIEGNFANPASRSHIYGWRAEEAVELARRQVADLIDADTREIVWTSGATESNNLAIKGLAAARKRFGKHIICSQIEHKSVLDTCAELERQGYEVDYIAPTKYGCLDTSAVLDKIRSDTIIISVMHANNETGSINPIKALGETCRKKSIAFHVDAAQSAGKIPVSVRALNIDLLSISAHKLYGPKGVGALYVRRCEDIVVEAQMHGGGHERGMRSGTLATHQIAGFGLAAELAAGSLSDEQKRISALREKFWQGLQKIGGVQLNGSFGSALPSILNVTFSEVDGESLLLSLQSLAISTGSACTSASIEPSYVLRAMGVSKVDAHASLRFSLGRYTKAGDIDKALAAIKAALRSLRPSFVAS